MTLTQPCPVCHTPQTMSDPSVGTRVRCANCQAEFEAGNPAPGGPPGRTPPPQRVRRLTLALVVLACVAAAGAYWAVTRPTPIDVADPDGIFSARFPNPVTTERSDGNPLALKVGERLTQAAAGGKEYSVAVLDSLNNGDQEVGPAGRDAQVNSALAIVLANSNGNKLVDRPVTHEGHAAREVAYVSRDDDRLTALRFVGGEHYVVRMAVTGSGDRAEGEAFLNRAAGFFDGVHLGPGFGLPVLEDPIVISAAGLAAAYHADRAAADTKYKDRWVRVDGRVRAVAADGQEFELDAGGGVVVVRRAARARMSVPVRRAGESATATGKCRGPDPAATGPDPRVVLENATVLRPVPVQ